LPATARVDGGAGYYYFSFLYSSQGGQKDSQAEFSALCPKDQPPTLV
jgi:hypothetical protein